MATAAHTLVVQSDEDAAVTGKAADVIAAANTALEAAIRLIRPGKKIADVRHQCHRDCDSSIAYMTRLRQP